LRRIIAACVDQMSARAQSRDVSISYGDCEPVILRADRRRIKEIMLSLLDNAIKFNRAGGSVTISALSDPAAGSLRVTVADTGCGVAESEKERLFTPFYQNDNTLRREHEGIGLGLPIVRRYAEMHGGSIEIDSQVDVGAAFTIKLPLAMVVGRENCAPQPAPSFT
jgi:signal transduction histidine kinase